MKKGGNARAESRPGDGLRTGADGGKAGAK